MQDIVRVRWTATSLETPRVWQNCNRCDARTPFVCSGKFRINAQGKRIDAWLIYRCARCDQTWNYPILERTALTEIDPSHLQALSENCGRLAQRHAFDVMRLRQYSDQIEESDRVAVQVCLLGRCDGEPRTLAVSIAVPRPCRMRLDRLLATGLGLSRGEVRRLHDAAVLIVSPASRTALRQPVRDGQTVTVDLRCVGSASRLLSAALRDTS
ncbi:MAG TPA: DUF1062 domain-containing protein [Hyphomicrobiaceae bacterium]|jgi:hypothetical protein|nr:DUF1062 domain-containing protein [Hyphomicrobiaceae bacterium]